MTPADRRRLDSHAIPHLDARDHRAPVWRRDDFRLRAGVSQRQDFDGAAKVCDDFLLIGVIGARLRSKAMSITVYCNSLGKRRRIVDDYSRRCRSSQDEVSITRISTGIFLASQYHEAVRGDYDPAMRIPARRRGDHVRIPVRRREQRVLPERPQKSPCGMESSCLSKFADSK